MTGVSAVVLWLIPSCGTFSAFGVVTSAEAFSAMFGTATVVSFVAVSCRVVLTDSERVVTESFTTSVVGAEVAVTAGSVVLS